MAANYTKGELVEVTREESMVFGYRGTITGTTRIRGIVRYTVSFTHRYSGRNALLDPYVLHVLPENLTRVSDLDTRESK